MSKNDGDAHLMTQMLIGECRQAIVRKCSLELAASEATPLASLDQKRWGTDRQVKIHYHCTLILADAEPFRISL